MHYFCPMQHIEFYQETFNRYLEDYSHVPKDPVTLYEPIQLYFGSWRKAVTSSANLNDFRNIWRRLQ